ncbi:hypothetical protein WYI_11354 [Ochrobactrum sp. CDB2]|nr:hypothetical protein WYI_11354 [Ochrobactrum sp. CDB2]
MQKKNIGLCKLCQNTLCAGILVIGLGLIATAGALIALLFKTDPKWGALTSLLLMLVILAAISFPLKMSDGRRSKMLGKVIIHYTSAENRPGIERIVDDSMQICIRPSQGFKNLFNWLTVGRCAFFFSSKPSRLQHFVNLCGRGSATQSAHITIRTEDLPQKIYWRIWDGSILLPNGYCGPGQFIEAKAVPNVRG